MHRHLFLKCKFLMSIVNFPKISMTTSVYICILLNFNINTEYTVCLQKLDTHVKLLYYWFYQKNLFFIKHCTWSKTNIQSSDFMSRIRGF